MVMVPGDNGYGPNQRPRPPKGGATSKPTPNPRPQTPPTPPPKPAATTTGTAAGAAAGAAVAPNPNLQKTLGKGRYSCPLHLHSLPAAAWGTNAQFTARRGRVYALVTQNAIPRKTNWVYQFLFNPRTITVATQINNEVTADIQYDKIGLIAAGQQGISGLELQIDRQLEVTGVPSTGQAQHPDLPLVRKYGTYYDYEYLMRVINGDPRSVDEYLGTSTADIGFLNTTMLRFVFGPSFAFQGFVSALNIEHKLFNASMVPMVSTITLDVVRMTGAVLGVADTEAQRAADAGTPPKPAAGSPGATTDAKGNTSYQWGAN